MWTVGTLVKIYHGGSHLSQRQREVGLPVQFWPQTKALLRLLQFAHAHDLRRSAELFVVSERFFSVHLEAL